MSDERSAGVSLEVVGGSAVPMTPELRRLLQPDLCRREPIFTDALRRPERGEKVYELSHSDIAAIRRLRGATVDLHPGMGGVSPEKLIDMIESGVELTSLDFMLTRGCNFACTWCFAGSDPHQKDFIPFEILESLTRDAADLGTSLFILTGGEPLVYRDPALGKQRRVGDHFFRVVAMIRDAYAGAERQPKILTFDDVALITPSIASQLAEYKIGLCTKGDTLIAELQDYKVNQKGAFERMQRGYEHLMAVGYGRDPELRLVVNSVLDHTTLDGMLDLHVWVMERGFDHSIVPVHYCGNAADVDQEAGIHSPHVKVLYDLIARVDRDRFGVDWKPWSAFTYNKTCNRNRSGLHVRADGDVTACSESPNRCETEAYTFGNVFDDGFSLSGLVRGRAVREFRRSFLAGHGAYVCSPEVCDLYANDLCIGGCAVRSAYSRMDTETGLIKRNDDPHRYSQFREDPLCPAWTELASRQGILESGLLENIHDRILGKSECVAAGEFPFESSCRVGCI